MRESTKERVLVTSEQIIKTLEESGKDGLWFRELARRVKIPVTTLWYWLKNYPQYFLNVEKVRSFGGNIKKDHLVLIKLKGIKR